jgi:hypothetical protein
MAEIPTGGIPSRRFQAGDRVRFRPGSLAGLTFDPPIRPDEVGEIIDVEPDPPQTGPSYRISVRFSNARDVAFSFSTLFELVEPSPSPDNGGATRPPFAGAITQLGPHDLPMRGTRPPGVFAGRGGDTPLPIRAEVALTGTSSLQATATVAVTRAISASERDEILRRLDATMPALQQLLPFIEAIEAVQRVSIGGNYPPEPIDPVPFSSAQIRETLVADRALRGQLSSNQPSFDAIHLCGLALKRAAELIDATLPWLARKADLYTDEVVKSVGKLTIPLAVALEIMKQSHVDLAEVAARVLHLIP